jgi:transposase
VVPHGAVKGRTRAINQFKALLVSAPEVVRDGLRDLSFTEQLARARRWPDGHGDDVERETCWSLKELARRIGFQDEQTARLEARIGALAAQASPALMGLSGVGPHLAAQLLAAAGDNRSACTPKLRLPSCVAPAPSPPLRARPTATG